MNVATFRRFHVLRPLACFRRRWKIGITAALCGLFATLAGIMLAVPLVANGQQASILNRAAVAENYGKLQLSFEANQGQSDPQVKFLSRGNGYSLFLTDSSAVLALTKQEASNAKPGRAVGKGPQASSLPQARKTDVVRMSLAGASPGIHVAGVDQLPGRANYFIGNDPAKWHSGVPTYSKVQYTGVYPGVNLIYYGNQRQLEYDFVVAPAADSKSIRLRFAGVEKLKLTADGGLAILAKSGEIAFHKPVIYQLKDGQREPVEGRFLLLARHEVGFTVGLYDHTKPLVIDPVLVYSTYLGGSGGDLGTAIAVDGSGDSYVTGETLSTNFPVTSGAYKTVNHGSAAYAAFVTKFNPTGSALLYSTYLGDGAGAAPGTNHIATGASGLGIAVDSAGDAYVTGSAGSYFPTTTGAFQTKNNAAAYNMGTYTVTTGNAFVTKLNPTGSALVYSTYLGGSASYVIGDFANAIAVDSSGDAYVTGLAVSTNFPVTLGAFQTANHTTFDNTGFVTELNATGSALLYSTYLGGSNDDQGYGIAVDSSGDAYVTGVAYSTDFPVTPGAFQTTNKSVGGSNAFVSKINPTGSSLVYSTYLGGSSGLDIPFHGINALDGTNASDIGTAIAVDGSGSAYVTGFSTSTDFPITSGAFQATNKSAGGSNAFVSKINPTGSGLGYSTYLGGSSGVSVDGYGDEGSGIAIDDSGEAYVTGQVYSTDFPVTSGAYQTANDAASGFSNAFVSKLNSTGNALLYSTYLGGSGRAVNSYNYGDLGNAIAVDSAGGTYVTGQAASANFPVTAGAFQTTNSSNGTTAVTNAFVAKLNLDTAAAPKVTVTPTSSSITTTQALSVTVGVSGTNSGPTPTGAVTLSSGSYSSAAKTLSSGSATIDVPAGSLAPGSDTLTASYMPDSSSSALYSSTSGTSTPVMVALTTPDVTVSPSASSITTAQALTVTVAVSDGSGNPTPTGSVTLTSGSYTAQQALASGSSTFTVAAGALAAGNDTLSATYTPDTTSTGVYTTANQSVTVTVTTPIGTSASTVTVTPSATSITDLQPVDVTVSVAGGNGQQTPTGTVTLAGGTYSAQQTLAGGSTSFNIPAGTLSSGANTLTASYSGDGTYAITSGTTAVTVSPVVISVQAPSAVLPGASTTATVTLTAGSTFSGTMNVTCALTGSPAGAQSPPNCSLNPASVTIAAGGSGTTVLTMNTTAASTAFLVQPSGRNLWSLGGGGAVLAVMLLCGIPSRRRRWMSMLVLLAAFIASGVIGCIGGSGTTLKSTSNTPATTAGNYTFTVTATSGTVTASTTIPLSVQ